MMMWGTTSPNAKLTDDSGSAFEAPLIGDCRLFRSLARNQPPRLLGLLQQYRHQTDQSARSHDVRSSGDTVAKVPRDGVANFSAKNETSDNRRSIEPQTRYRSRP